MNLRRTTRGWLLWLALLLPLAQAVAGVHALSHVSDNRDDGIAHLVHCDLCLTAAGLGSGAPATTAPVLATGPAVHAVPRLAVAPAPRAADALRPPARGPPLSA